MKREPKGRPTGTTAPPPPQPGLRPVGRAGRRLGHAVIPDCSEIEIGEECNPSRRISAPLSAFQPVALLPDPGLAGGGAAAQRCSLAYLRAGGSWNPVRLLLRKDGSFSS